MFVDLPQVLASEFGGGLMSVLTLCNRRWMNSTAYSLANGSIRCCVQTGLALNRQAVPWQEDQVGFGSNLLERPLAPRFKGRTIHVHRAPLS